MGQGFDTVGATAQRASRGLLLRGCAGSGAVAGPGPFLQRKPRIHSAPQLVLRAEQDKRGLAVVILGHPHLMQTNAMQDGAKCAGCDAKHAGSLP